MLADVTHGGTWHIGVLAAPGIPEMLLTGRERDFLAGYAYPAMSGTEGAISEQDIDEFTRAYSRPDGFRGATGLYRSMLKEGEEIKQIVAQQQLTMPVLAVGAGTGQFTYDTMAQVAQNVTRPTSTASVTSPRSRTPRRSLRHCSASTERSTPSDINRTPQPNLRCSCFPYKVWRPSHSVRVRAELVSLYRGL